MIKSKNRQIFLIYVIVFAITWLIFDTIGINAQENSVVEPRVVDQIFEVEINNNLNFEEVKNKVLIDDVKYVAHPENLSQDVSLSEIVASDIDYSSFEVQHVDLEVQRFTDSKLDKVKIDSVNGAVNIKFVDTTPPKIKIKKDSVTITEGENLNVKSYLVSVTDNSFDEVSIDIDENIKTKVPGKYKAVYTATDSSGNSASKTLNVIVKAKPKPKPKPKPIQVETAITKSVTNNSNVATTGNGFLANRVTRYGYDCRGCSVNQNNFSTTASGIKIGADRVLQANGQWQQGYTYEGYHIIATSSKLPLFSIVKIINHPFSGGGIAAGQPFLAIVGDRGVGGNNIDLFIGTERNIGAISQSGSPSSSNTKIEVIRYGR